MRVDTRKLVMGDWSRTVRDPLDVRRLAFLAGAVAFAVAVDVAGAFNLLLGFRVLLAARFANLPRVYDLALIVALVLTQWGEAFGLHDALPWYDRVVHVIVPLLSSQVIADAFGALCGGALMVLWSRRGWGSVRRIPGENRRESVHA